MLRQVSVHLLVAAALVTAGCAGLGPPASQSGGGPTPTATAQTDRPQSGAQQSVARRTNAYRSFEQLYDRTIDSVVEIRVQTARGTAQGSGFVYSEGGYIVTNQHVVADAETVRVRFRNGSWMPADVVGTDVYTDLAVLQVSSLPPGVDPLPVARSTPEPGQPVVALGSPLGYEGSITQGIISGVNRSMETAQGFAIPDTIQTDAPINPGNSGGPLVTTNGTVIGVNRAKRGDDLGFAISADVVRTVVPSLVEDGEYHHAFLGVRTVRMTPQIAAANDRASTRGVMVVAVFDGGPAADALQPARLAPTETGQTVPVGGDIIVGVDGRRIETQHDLAQYLMLHTRPGDEVQVTVIRDGQRVTETVTLGQRPELSATESV